MPSRQLWYIAAVIAAVAVVMLMLLYVLSVFRAPPALERSLGPGGTLLPPDRLEQPLRPRLARLGQLGRQPVVDDHLPA